MLREIKAEIERLKDKAANAITPDMLKHKVHYYGGREDVCKELLAFVESLQEEPVYRELGKAAYDYGCTHLTWKDDGGEWIDTERPTELAFLAGAEWQKQQEYTCYEEAFEDGSTWKKEQVIEKAVEWLDGFMSDAGYWDAYDRQENIKDFKQAMEE